MRDKNKRAARIIAALVFMSALAVTVAGQPSPRRTGRAAAPDTLMTESERELMLEEMAAPKPARRPRARAPFAQLSADFTRIQVINNALAQAALRAVTLDLEFVAKLASDIRKIAERLKTNLDLPKPAKDAERPKPQTSAEREQLRSAVVELGKLVAGFAHNPVFKQSGVVDVKLSAKARGDLEEIIELSGQLRKDSERLSKAAPTSP
ncbi:MAG: hypothetical protein QOF02_4059 [Blastocatellia bacterium]|jgi:hypothetical protein|nr:hypothetical protein [Blastocatellia bacterium]